MLTGLGLPAYESMIEGDYETRPLIWRLRDVDEITPLPALGGDALFSNPQQVIPVTGDIPKERKGDESGSTQGKDGMIFTATGKVDTTQKPEKDNSMLVVLGIAAVVGGLFLIKG